MIIVDFLQVLCAGEQRGGAGGEPGGVCRARETVPAGQVRHQDLDGLH